MINADETKQRYVDTLGLEFGRIFYELYNDWASGNVKLSEFRLLYGNIENVVYVNTFGGLFFGHIQAILLDDLLLNVTRLTDPVQSGKGKKNLTIQLFPDYVENEQLREEIFKGVGAAKNAADFARDWRNRRISHKDYNLEMGKDAEPLKNASLEKIGHALTAVHCVLNLVNVRYLNSPIANSVFYPPKIEGMIRNLKRRGV